MGLQAQNWSVGLVVKGCHSLLCSCWVVQMFATTLRGPSLTALAADSTRLGHYFSELPNLFLPLSIRQMFFTYLPLTVKMFVTLRGPMSIVPAAPWAPPILWGYDGPWQRFRTILPLTTIFLSPLAFSFFENATKMPKNRPRTVKLVRV